MRVESGFLGEMARESTGRLHDAIQREPLPHLRRRALDRSPPIPLGLEDNGSTGGFDLIAEIKFRSPANGPVAGRQAADLERRLHDYVDGGAAAVSVLTEPSRFGGSLGDLEDAATAVGPSTPLMRKDFLVDPYQVLEARASGASGVLLIARLVSKECLVEMVDCARETGLFVLLEAFDRDDLDAACTVARSGLLDDGQLLVGVNCRDLDTLAVDTGRAERLAGDLPPGVPSVAESGIADPDDAEHVARLGYRLGLVGTALMRSAEPRALIASMLAAGRSVGAQCG